MTPAADAVALWAIAARITEFGFMGLSAPADILVVTAPGVGRRTRFQVVVPTGQRFEERVRSLSSRARQLPPRSNVSATVFPASDIEVCRRCGGKLRVIASIEEQATIERILEHLGESVDLAHPRQASRRSPSRAPPESDSTTLRG